MAQVSKSRHSATVTAGDGTMSAEQLHDAFREQRHVVSSGMSTSPTPFIIMRSSGHSGSGWLSQLFQTQRLAFFFEFTGRCEKGRNVTVELDRTFEEGCSCARSAVPAARLAAACRRPVEKVTSGEKESQNCEKLALCHTSCPGPAPTPFACQAVGMVQSASIPWLERIAAFQLSRAALKVHFLAKHLPNPSPNPNPDLALTLTLTLTPRGRLKRGSSRLSATTHGSRVTS